MEDLIELQKGVSTHGTVAPLPTPGVQIMVSIAVTKSRYPS